MTSPAKQKAVFFDRDGVLNVDKGYVHRIEDFEWVDGAIDTLKQARSFGYLTIVVTNQSGVARGYYGRDEVESLHRWINEQLHAVGTLIDAFYYCPFHPDADVAEFRHPNHPDRKPNPGMLLRAIADWNLDPEKSFLIGDNERDLTAADRAHVRSWRFDGGRLRLPTALLS